VKTLFVKLASIVLILFVGISASANTFTNLGDTALMSSVYIPESFYKPTIVKKANVVYPGLFTPHFTNTISYVENFSNKRKKYLTILYKKSKDFFPQVTEVFQQYNIPQEFKVLMAIESGFNANALSPVGALGYWQFMGASAKEYGLRVNMKVRNINYKYTAKKIRSKRHRSRVKKYVIVDDRKDLMKSTHAAAKYLKDRCRELNNDWLLVAASYNCGVGNVRKAIKKSGIECATFWEVQQFLPKETRNYVMNFITLNVIFENYDKYEQGTLCFKDLIYTPVDTEINNQFCEEDFSTCMTEVPCFRF
jgi:membrane-bound lytic murein transglycosylase D